MSTQCFSPPCSCRSITRRESSPSSPLFLRKSDGLKATEYELKFSLLNHFNLLFTLVLKPVLDGLARWGVTGGVSQSMRILPHSPQAQGKAKFPLATIPADSNSLDIFGLEVVNIEELGPHAKYWDIGKSGCFGFEVSGYWDIRARGLSC